MGINKCIQIGRLVKNPEVKQTAAGTSVTSFSMAIDQSYKNKEGTKIDKVSFFNYNVWGKLGEVIAQYCTKGQQIVVESEPEQQTWETESGKRSAVNFKVSNFSFASSKSESSQPETKQEPLDIQDNPFDAKDLPF